MIVPSKNCLMGEPGVVIFPKTPRITLVIKVFPVTFRAFLYLSQKEVWQEAKKSIMKVLFILAAILCVASCQQSFCDKYRLALNVTGNTLITNVILGVFGNITTPGSPIKMFFDGTVINFPGGLLINFTLAGTYQTTLVLHLVQFFHAALGCTDNTTGAYQGATLPASHTFMSINNAQFGYFEAAVGNVLTKAGVSATDLAGAVTILETTRASICNQADCFPATSSIAATKKAAAVSFSPLFAAIFLAIAALLNM